MAVNLKHAMDEIVATHGHAAPVETLAALVGWQGRWAPPSQQERVASAARLLAEAAELLRQLEAEEEGERREARLGAPAADHP